MSKTRHIQARMSQRAINQELVDLALRFGVEQGDGKVVLNRRASEALTLTLKAMYQAAEKATAKGGVVVVRDGNALITTYRLDSYHRSGAAR